MVPLIFADVCLMHARRPGPGKHWGETEVAGGGFDEVFLRSTAGPKLPSPLGPMGLSNKGLVKLIEVGVDFLYHIFVNRFIGVFHVA